MQYKNINNISYSTYMMLFPLLLQCQNVYLDVSFFESNMNQACFLPNFLIGKEQQ